MTTFAGSDRTVSGSAWPSRFRAGSIPGAWIVLWWPQLFLGQVLFARDLEAFTLPAKHFLVETLRSGEFPFWTPYVSTGLPFFSDVAGQTLYPLNPIIALAPTITVGLTWFLIAHSLAGMYACRYLLRVLEVSPNAATWGSILYGAAGYVVCITDNLTYVSGVLWVPLALGFFLAGLNHNALRYTGLAAVCTAMLVLAGNVQDLPILGFALVTLGLLRSRSHSVPSTDAKRRQSPLRVGSARREVRMWQWAPGRSGFMSERSFACFHLVGIFGFGAALSAAQVLPTLEMISWSNRDSGLGAAEVTAFSLAPARLAEWFLPFVFSGRFPAGEFLRPDWYPAFRAGWVDSVYLGVIPLALLGMGLRDRRALPFIVILLVAATLSLGRHVPGFTALLEAVPALQMFRYPEKAAYWVTLAAVVLASFGATRLDPGAFDRFTTTVVTTSLVLLIGCAYWLPSAYWPAAAFDRESALWSNLFFTSVTNVQGHTLHTLASATLLVLFAISGARWAARRYPHEATRIRKLTLGLAIINLVWIHQGHLPTTPSAIIEDFEPRAAVNAVLTMMPGATDPLGPRIHFDHTNFQPDAALTTSPIWQYAGAPWASPNLLAALLNRARLAPNAPTRLGLRYHNGQTTPLQPAQHRLLESEWLNVAPDIVLRYAGVGYVLTTIAPPNPVLRRLTVSAVHNFTPLNLRLMILNDPRPFAYLTTENIARDFAERLQAANDALLSPKASPRKFLSPTITKIDAVRRPAPHRIELEVEVTGPGQTLVITESFFPGWQAWVDGEPRDVDRAHDRFLGLAVGPGKHEVKLRYRPSKFFSGVALSLGATLAVLLIIWLGGSKAPGKDV